MSFHRPRALNFDVDGTLAETEETHRKSLNKAFADAGLDWKWSKLVYAALLTTTGGKERIARYVTEQKIKHISQADIANIQVVKNRIYADSLMNGGLSLRPGVARLISDAKMANLKLGIATTTSRSNLLALLLCCFGPDGKNRFDSLVCGEDVQLKKPDPEVYLLCLEKLKVESHETIAFEDSGVGLRSALAAGLKTVITPTIFTKKENFSGASQVLADLTPFRL